MEFGRYVIGTAESSVFFSKSPISSVTSSYRYPRVLDAKMNTSLKSTPLAQNVLDFHLECATFGECGIGGWTGDGDSASGMEVENACPLLSYRRCANRKTEALDEIVNA